MTVVMATTQVLRDLVRPAVHLMREAPLYGEMARQFSDAPLAVFLPAYGPEGAALLRIYAVARQLRSLGWRTLVLPWRLTLVQRRRIIAAAEPDILVMQGARHGLNRPSLYPGIPIVYDMDDADFHLAHLEEPVRAAMPEVAAVIAGSAYVANWCRRAGAAQAHVVWTGSAVSQRRRMPQSMRPPVVAWAQTAPETYMAEADLVLDVMWELSRCLPEVRLRLYDWTPDSAPSFLDRFTQAGIQTEWCERLQYSDYLESLDDVAVGLAPLCPDAPFVRGKSFGKVLGYLDRHVPIIASDACEYGAFFTPQSAVVSNDRGVWVAELQRLLTDAERRQDMADAAFSDFSAQLSLEEVARQVDELLRLYAT